MTYVPEVLNIKVLTRLQTASLKPVIIKFPFHTQPII